MSRSDFDLTDIRKCAEEVQDTQRLLHGEGMTYSHWCGQLDDRHLRNGSTVANKGPNYEPLPWSYDDENIPWFTLWEYSWLLYWSRILTSSPKRILSLGGSSSSFDMTLARHGHHLTIVEQRPYTVDNTKTIAKSMGFDIEVVHSDIAEMGESLQCVGEPFDYMMSVNVLHLAGKAAQSTVKTTLHRYIAPGGMACFTFDYLNPNPARYVNDPIGHFDFDGFTPWPTPDHRFNDNGERHHFFYPDPRLGFYTAGALFLKRAQI